ncbi:unnamed protein product [Didymodactylos carnosus]|uniref:DBH-like monooxygenase protein 1 n=1 Tax=Didymodactylos carnosus TaxID=1234261 RepID=A0A813P9C6_9BILA|nr:unnamed protein product [Didymodactylos carnosus]CAF0749482.1 unnamed protein product [Didymodactylos carnosus]CAF3493371.1 unnamed protein product [Didymodactylos carnosus]CAF3528813.1 unnamed protein product [Didymodactylos carnosus]
MKTTSVDSTERELHFVILTTKSYAKDYHDIVLPSTSIQINLSSIIQQKSIYLCYLYSLNNDYPHYVNSYEILNYTDNLHHLLIYECANSMTTISSKYFGICGSENRHMPMELYEKCQTRIVLAWGRGGNFQYKYPQHTGLKLKTQTYLLLEIHYDPFINRQQSGIRFYYSQSKPKYEIGLLTLGTLVNSTIYLPPYLDHISFRTYCFNDCMQKYLANNQTLNVFRVLLHAHHLSKRIWIKKIEKQGKKSQIIIDQNPYHFNKQLTVDISVNLTNNDEIVLTCDYSTKYQTSLTRGGYNTNDEMCQAFFYYYPKIEQFPLCLSLPIYSELQDYPKWTKNLSENIRNRLVNNKNHLGLCGDNTPKWHTNRQLTTDVNLSFKYKQFNACFYAGIHDKIKLKGKKR